MAERGLLTIFNLRLVPTVLMISGFSLCSKAESVHRHQSFPTGLSLRVRDTAKEGCPALPSVARIP